MGAPEQTLVGKLPVEISAVWGKTSRSKGGSGKHECDSVHHYRSTKTIKHIHKKNSTYNTYFKIIIIQQNILIPYFYKSNAV